MRAAVLAAAVALAALPSAPAAAAPRCAGHPAWSARVPTWQAVNGFALGSRPATDGQIDAYLAAVDAASARVTTGVAGTSAEGRPLRYAVVSDPRTLAPARLRAVRARLAALRDATASPARAARMARDDPAIVWVAGSVHGNEPSGGDADMALLRELAARTDCATRARLRRLVVVILPVQNPDGRAAGTRTSATGFDLNRDWFAATQPETRARLALLRRLPPVALVDQHEQGGAASFVPPNADPIHHEIPRRALHAIDATFAPALRAAFARRGWPVESGSTFDLFYMGYGDAAPTTMAGAAAMTVEVGGGVGYARRTAEHLTAAEAVIATAARHKPELLRGWAATAREAREQGAHGELQPNGVWRAGDRLRFGVPRLAVYAYALAPGPGADALVGRLLRQGVRVERLRAPVRVARLDPFGPAPPAAAGLAAGTYVVSMAQPAKHWIEAVLGDDAYVPFPYFYDVSAWSQPLLMGLAGGALRALLPPHAPLERLTAAPAPAVAPPPEAGYVLRGDDARSLGLALDLLQRGVALRRVPDEGEVVAGPEADPGVLRAAAAARGASIAPLDPGGAPGDTVPLRAARVALLADPGATTAVRPGDPVPTLSPAWCRWVVEQRFGLHVDVLGDGDLAAGRLQQGDYTAFLVPDGQQLDAGLGPAALERLGAFVRAGGTYVGWRSRGLDVAAAAGLTTARATAPPDLHVAGAAVRIEVDHADPLGWGFAGGGPYVLDQDDPVIAGGDHVAARFPPAARFWRSGYLTGEAALAGTAAALDEQAGAGHAVLFSFDPAFRGYTDGAERLLANALLLAPTAPPA